MAHDHNKWDAIILDAVVPTCTATGLTEGKKCSGCGETLETAVIEALPEVTEPETEPETEPDPETAPETESNMEDEEKTGCSSMVGGWIFLPLVLAFFALVRKKKFD